MSSIVIDTSAWIEAFRPKGDPGLAGLVKDSILRGEVLLPGIIKTELLRGARDQKEFEQLNDLLKGMTYAEVSEEFWDRLALFSFQLFKNGVVVPLTDTYIALLCIENNASILHRDRHFDLIARESPLKVLACPS